MDVEASWTLDHRAALHRALGDPRRLAIVDALQHSDRLVGDLGELTRLSGNLLAFHLKVLEEAGAIQRHTSGGDARRRYVSLDTRVLPLLGDPPPLPGPAQQVLFVCTANSARSQLAALLWHERTGGPAGSAGTDPAPAVDPGAVAVAQRHGFDLTRAHPTAYHEVRADPDLVVSVCDRAHEQHAELAGVPLLHWSIPDPVGRGDEAFEAVFGQLTDRIDRLARSLTSPISNITST